MNTVKYYRTELEKRVKSSFKERGISIKDGAKLINMSASKLHDVFKNHDSIDDVALNKFSRYLEVDVEHIKALNALKLIDDSTGSNALVDIKTELKEPYTLNLQFRAIVFASATCLLIFVFFLIEFNQVRLIHYQGTGRDLAPQKLTNEQFNPPLYLYDIHDLKLDKRDNELTMSANLAVIDAATNEVVITGLMKGTGFYYGDQASIAYKVENASNGESWACVFMVDAPESGDLKGYWLTSHNDTNSKYGFRYLIGEVLAERCDISKTTCVAPKLALVNEL